MIRFEPQHFKEVEQFIWEYSGILIDRVPKKGVSERIKKHIETLGLKGINDYMHLLHNPGTLPIRDELMSHVTVNESFFFRNPTQFRFLAKDLLPKLCEQKHQNHLKQISIWSAGCATGEEAYSLAYIGEWVKRQFPDIRFHLMGSDINTFSLEKARQGIFRKRSIRAPLEQIMEEFKSPFLQERGETFSIIPELRESVLFKFINLRDLAMLRLMNKMDVIFCRNVLIYFDDTFKQELLQTFNHILHPGGYLFLGETESLPQMPHSFELMNCHGAFCYRKISPQDK